MCIRNALLMLGLQLLLMLFLLLLNLQGGSGIVRYRHINCRRRCIPSSSKRVLLVITRMVSLALQGSAHEQTDMAARWHALECLIGRLV